jgi:hypothetical protein
LAAISVNSDAIILCCSLAYRDKKAMEKRQFVRTLGLVLVLGVTGLAGGCGPAALSPADQEKVNATIKNERAGRHKELNEQLKAAKQLQGNAQQKQAVARKAAHRRTGGP